MKKTGTTRFRAAALVIAAALGATLFVAPQALADTQSDATEAINQLAEQISDSADGANRGFNNSGLGNKVGEVSAIAGTEGYKQSFSGGTIYWDEAQGARVLYGVIDSTYNNQGGPAGGTEIGFPTTSEEASTVATRQASFAGEGDPTIYWTPQNGGWLVRGPFAVAVDRFGATLGAPTGAIAVNEAAGTVSQAFANGTLTWNIRDGKFVDVDSLNPALAGVADVSVPNGWANLGLPGVSLPGLSNVAVPTTNADGTVPDTSNDDASWNKNWLWLLLLIPLLLGLWYVLTRRKSNQVVHAPRPSASAATPKIDVKAPAANVDAPATGADAQTTSFEVADLGGKGAGGCAKGTAAVAGAAAAAAAGAAAAKGKAAGAKDEVAEAKDATDEAAEAKDESAETVVKHDPASPSESATQVMSTEGLKGAAGLAGAAGVAGAAGAGAAKSASAAGEPGGDGVGTYEKNGASVPVPVGAHLPLADPQQAPEGYPIKGNADSGLFHTPDSPGYAQTVAEIWFATEGAARAAGFRKAS